MDDAGAVEQATTTLAAQLTTKTRNGRPRCGRLALGTSGQMLRSLVWAQRPVDWPPTQDVSTRVTSEIFDDYLRRDKTGSGCRIRNSGEFDGLVRLATDAIVKALLPVGAATGVDFTMPPGWTLFSVGPGRASFTTFEGQYIHGGIIPGDGAEFTVYNATERASADAWFAYLSQNESVGPREAMMIDGLPATRATTTAGFDVFQLRDFWVIVKRGDLAHRFSFGWYADEPGEERHLADAEHILSTVRFVH